MVGWWAESNPVRTGSAEVLATAYLKKGGQGKTRAMIALASWARDIVDVRLEIDWKALGLDPGRSRLRAPAIDKFQPSAEFKPGDTIRVEPGKGWLLVVGD